MNSQEQKYTSLTGDISFGQLFRIINQERWYVFIISLTFVIFGVFYAYFSTPIYMADALIQVESGQSDDIQSLVGNISTPFSDNSSTASEIAIIKSRLILGKTVDDLGLTTQVSANYFPLIGEGLARITKKKIV